MPKYFLRKSVLPAQSDRLAVIAEMFGPASLCLASFVDCCFVEEIVYFPNRLDQPFASFSLCGPHPYQVRDAWL